ncbi:MAG: hypothetical protein AAGI72_23570 [Pseudomonadota bacterium]
MRGFRYKTRKGTFYIWQLRDGWHPYFDDEDLGCYATAQTALDDLAGGHTFFPSSGVDPSTCGLPDEIGEWDPVRARQA